MKKSKNLLKTRCEVCGRHFWSNETRVVEGNLWYHLNCYFEREYNVAS